MVNERLKPDGIEIGRDRLFELLRVHNLLIRRRRQPKRTTWSSHRLRKYGNLIRDLELNRPNQVYVADITYLQTLEGFCYLALITDAYSRKIVGYDVSHTLCFEGSLRALDNVATPDPAAGDGASRIYNIGNHESVDIGTFVDLLEKELGKKAERNPVPMQPGDVTETFADVDALERATGFRPRTPLAEGVRRFVQWFRSYEEGPRGARA